MVARRVPGVALLAMGAILARGVHLGLTARHEVCGGVRCVPVTPAWAGPLVVASTLGLVAVAALALLRWRGPGARRVAWFVGVVACGSGLVLAGVAARGLVACGGACLTPFPLVVAAGGGAACALGLVALLARWRPLLVAAALGVALVWLAGSVLAWTTRRDARWALEALPVAALLILPLAWLIRAPGVQNP